MTGSEVARVEEVDLSADTLTYLGWDPNRIEVRVLVLLCRRYHLDPLLKHVQLITPKGGGGAQPYITRDGMLHVAHESGQLDGIVVDEQRESDNGYSATVSVWRRDMAHPFTYKGGCGKTEPQAAAGNGAAMALARAERRALRRAFDLPAYDGADEPEDPPPPDPARHVALMQADGDGRIVCSCGEVFATVWQFGAHRNAMRDAAAVDKPPTSPGEVAAPEPPPGRPEVVVSMPARPPAAANHPTMWRDGTPMFDPQTGKPL